MSERASQPASTSKQALQLQRATSADHRLQRNTHPLLTTYLPPLLFFCCCKASDALNEMCSS